MAEKKRILVIDDEPDITMLLSSLLEFHDYIVRTMNDPTLVMETLENEKFDLICTDIMMPNLDGFALIKKIREREKNKVTKLIAVSAKEFSDEEYHFLVDNKVLIIKKPYDPQDLVNKINTMFIHEA
ncbi:MAG TPA: response regulator [Bdellovibrionota bacterium]|nr:response regulator [Bdellovibrionota bacterium]